MSETINIYCDESGHLPNDGLPVMTLGAVWRPDEKKREITVRIREIKRRHGQSAEFELKWTKVSPAGRQLYLDLIDYFFDDDDCHARILIVPDKAKLDHARFNQNHDTWYYKMYYQLLTVLLKPRDRYRIYLDVKDTRSSAKIRKLHEVLANTMLDFDHRIIERVQAVRSEEVEQVQLADLLTGAIAYANRGLDTNQGKLAVVQRIRERSTYSLTKSTLLQENKLNLIEWRAQEATA